MFSFIKGAALGLVIGAIGAFFFARDYYRADAEITALKSQIAAKDADLRIAKSAESTARSAALALEQKATETKEYLNEREREVASRPGRDACRLDDADALRLRSIK